MKALVLSLLFLVGELASLPVASAMGAGSGGQRAAPAPEKAPFNEACQEPNAIQGRPRTGLFVRQYPVSDLKGNRSSDFLINVLDLALQKLDRDLTFVENLKACHNQLSGTPDCAELVDFAKVQVPQLLKDVRFHLAVSQSPKDLNSGFGQTDTSPNYRMRAFGTVKLKTWERTDKEEYQVARETLKNYQSEIIQHYLKTWGREKYTGSYGERMAVKQSLIQVRFQHFQQYRSYMAAAPFLQYFTQANPTVPQVLEAFLEFQVNAQKEKELLLSFVDRLSASASNGQIDEIVGTVLQYSAYVEFALMERPDLCGLATSLMYTQFNRALGTGIAIGLPLLAASFFMPGLIAYPLGVIASVYFVNESVQTYQVQKTRAGSVLFLAPNGSADMLLEAQDQLQMEVVLFPLSLVGGRFFGTAMRARWGGKVVADSRLNMHTYLPQSILRIVEKFSRTKL